MRSIRASISSGLSTVQNLGSVFTAAAAKGIRNIQFELVPRYLEHLLWLIAAKFRDLVKEGYRGNAAVYAVLRVLSTSVPEPPLIPYIRDAEGEPGEPLPWAHPLRALIRNPNPFQTEYEMWELITLHLAIVGISHWYKERDNAGRVIGLWPLRPDRVGPIYAGPDDDVPVLLGWSYLVPGTTHYEPIPARDVLVINFPDPLGESGGLVEGLGPLQALAAEIGADNAATRFVGSLVDNYATPGMILQVKGAVQSEDDARIIKAAFMRDFGGARRGQPAVVGSETTVNAVSFSLQQLEFPSLRQISESRIAAVVGVPAILAGLFVGLDASSTNATVDQLREFFADTTCSNYWRRIAEAFGKGVASEFGSNIVCRHDLTKVKALARWTQVDIQRIAYAYVNGAITKNEYRDMLHYEPREDGDVYVTGIAQGQGVEVDVPAGNDSSYGDDTGVIPGAQQNALPMAKASARSAMRRGRQPLLDDDAEELMQRAMDAKFRDVMTREKAAHNGH